MYVDTNTAVGFSLEELVSLAKWSLENEPEIFNKALGVEVPKLVDAELTIESYNVIDDTATGSYGSTIIFGGQVVESGDSVDVPVDWLLGCAYRSWATDRTASPNAETEKLMRRYDFNESLIKHHGIIKVTMP